MESRYDLWQEAFAALPEDDGDGDGDGDGDDDGDGDGDGDGDSDGDGDGDGDDYSGTCSPLNLQTLILTRVLECGGEAAAAVAPRRQDDAG